MLGQSCQPNMWLHYSELWVFSSSSAPSVIKLGAAGCSQPALPAFHFNFLTISAPLSPASPTATRALHRLGRRCWGRSRSQPREQDQGHLLVSSVVLWRWGQPNHGGSHMVLVLLSAAFIFFLFFIFLFFLVTLAELPRLLVCSLMSPVGTLAGAS